MFCCEFKTHLSFKNLIYRGFLPILFTKADIIGPQYLEGEAEFGCPPSQEATGYMVPCDNHLQIQPSIMGTGTTVMFVSAATTEDSLKDTNNKDMDHKCSSMLYARL